MVGSDLTVSGPGWDGKGSFDGKKGYYDWEFKIDGQTGTTKIYLDSTGTLFGRVKEDEEGGINWTYWASRKANNYLRSPDKTMSRGGIRE